jgi:hypothetical protein
MSNVEQGLPAFGGARGDQGILNEEVKCLLLFPSAFVIRYSIFCGSPASGGFAFELVRILRRSLLSRSLRPTTSLPRLPQEAIHEAMESHLPVTHARADGQPEIKVGILYLPK